MEIARSASDSTGCDNHLVAGWELEVAGRLASKFSRNSALLRHLYEPDDLHQEILLHWLRVRDRYSVRDLDSRKAIMWKVGTNCLLEIIRSERTDRRRVGHEAQSFLAPSPGSQSSEPLEGSVVKPDEERDETTVSGLAIDLERVATELTDRDRKILPFLVEGVPQVEIARRLGVDRDTVRMDILRVRKLFLAKGLKDYLR